jgi:tetratricopeptide (TPR) repeat protein/transcriptional regulator with XRE-family HTH domain
MLNRKTIVIGRAAGPPAPSKNRMVAPKPRETDMVQPESDDQLRRQLRTLQRVVGAPTDAVLARRSGVAPATFSEVMSGKRRPREEFVAKVVAGCVMSARTGGASLDEQRVLHALRLPGYTAADSGILERDDDLDRCSAVLEGVRARAGATIVVEGVAGIGKSELLARVCAESAVRGVVPLGVRGNQRDQLLAFGGVRSLLRRWLAGLGADEQQRLFAGAAAYAGVPLGLQVPHHGSPGTVIGATEALYWLLVNAIDVIGAREPDVALLFAIDDAHWLDQESVDWLEFVADRLSGLPIALVLAYRPNEPGASAALNRIALRATQIIRPRPLTRDAVRTVVSRGQRRRGRDHTPDESFCSAIHLRSGGNPFYLRWMLDLAHDRGLAVAGDEVDRLTPRQVVIYLNERLSRLGTAAQRLAQTVAVLGPASSLEQATRLAGLPIEDGKREYDLLCKTAILADQSNMDFCHPIIRNAVYEDIEPSLRSDLHRAAAHQLHETGAGPEAVAAHLVNVRVASDPWVVDQLCAAAAESMAAGLASTAARYLERAIDEPPPPGLRCQVQLWHGQALALGETAAALPALLAAYDQAPDDGLRTEAAIALAKTNGYSDRLGDAVRGLDDAIERCGDSRSRDQLTAEQLLWAAWWADDPQRLDRMHLLDRFAPPLAGAGHVQRLLITLHAWSQVWRAEPRTEALHTIQRVIRDGVTFTDLDQGMEVGTITAFVHLFSDEVAVAGTLFDQAVEEFDRAGWRGTHLAIARAHQGNVALRQGRLADAVVDAGIALRLADRTGPGTAGEWFATGTLVEASLARGDITRATAVSAAHNYADPWPEAVILPIPQALYGTLELTRGETRKGIATLRRVGQWLDHAHMVNPSICPWRLDLATALRRTAPDEALEIASVAQRHADRFGAPVARGRAMRTIASLTADVDLLEESTSVLRDTGNRLEHALALTDLGSALIRRGHPDDARRPLSTALTLADDCGALALRTTIARQCESIGATVDTRRRRTSALSPDHRRAVRLAATGLSDSEIANDMVLGLTTATTLLHEAYDRLGVTSRAELRDAIKEGDRR